MKIENEFTVNAPVRQAWEVMLDLERIAPCLPGASIEEASGDEYQGVMAVKLGPISARYRGTIVVEEADETNHRAVLAASAKETRGQGTASATITTTLHENGDGTRVAVETDMQVTGKVAQFGRGIMQDVASELMGRFSSCVEREIVGGTTGDPAASVEEAPAAVETAGQATDNREEKPQRAAGRTHAPAAEPLDLGDVSRRALVQRLVPLAAGLGGMAGLLFLILRSRREPTILIKLKNFEIRSR